MYAIIGGTGLSGAGDFPELDHKAVVTPYGDVTLARHQARGGAFYFLARHGNDHAVPPHRINYRANVWALKEVGVERICAVNAVGGIHARLGPGNLAVPDQLIDYSWGRESTFYDGADGVQHIDFTDPYDDQLRTAIVAAARVVIQAGDCADRDLLDRGVFGNTQGPRLESAAEIRRMQTDGCDMVGMTAMPEAALARELGMAYGCLALSVNWAAGLGEDVISLEQMGRIVEQCGHCINLFLQQLLD
ncbi:MAG: S-methyl-5'-thioinosine phosphorylase [Gammaproteobacteria bacterium]